MAYIEIGADFGARHAGVLRRLLDWLSPDDEPARSVQGCKLAGPQPDDRRARGYMDDLDIAAGF